MSSEMTYSWTPGITLRDHFAGLAMQAKMLSPLPSFDDVKKFKGFTVAEYISTQAYEMADEMMKAREA